MSAFCTGMCKVGVFGWWVLVGGGFGGACLPGYVMPTIPLGGIFKTFIFYGEVSIGDVGEVEGGRFADEAFWNDFIKNGTVVAEDGFVGEV